MIRTRVRRASFALAAVWLAACASGSGGGGAGQATNGERDVVTEAQLANMDALNAFEALQRLKPSWLRARGTTTLTAADREGVRVYVDRVLLGDVQALKSVAVRNIAEMRFLDSRKATLEFGTGHSSGAILVATRRGP